jgi:hypothetical protein
VVDGEGGGREHAYWRAQESLSSRHCAIVATHSCDRAMLKARKDDELGGAEKVMRSKLGGADEAEKSNPPHPHHHYDVRAICLSTDREFVSFLRSMHRDTKNIHTHRQKVSPVPLAPNTVIRALLKTCLFHSAWTSSPVPLKLT